MYPEGFELPVTCAILGFGPKLSFVALPPKNLHYGEMIHFEDFGHHFRERVWIIFIGPESDHWQCLSVTDSLTHSLTHCHLVNLSLIIGYACH